MEADKFKLIQEYARHVRLNLQNNDPDLPDLVAVLETKGNNKIEKIVGTMHHLSLKKNKNMNKKD